MDWLEPRHSRSLVDSAGRYLVLADENPEIEHSDPDTMEQVLIVVDGWRDVHATPLLELRSVVESTIASIALPDVQVVTRLKRQAAVVRKLVAQDGRLTQMQDIGGCRAITKSLDDSASLVRALVQQPHPRFVLQRHFNYTAAPRERTGYRSHHLVFSCLPPSDFVGAPKRATYRLELQVRSRLQHLWATAVEIASLALQRNLKDGGEMHGVLWSGQQHWVRRFQLIAELFARAEGAPPVGELGATEEVRRQVSSTRDAVSELLYSCSHVAETTPNEGNFFQLLTLDVNERSTSIETYTRGEVMRALGRYSAAEKRARQEPERYVVALVTTSDTAELVASYPNFFGDTIDFRGALDILCSDRPPIGGSLQW